MIIGLSGKIASGKNTIGDIIEKLCLTNNGPVFEQKAFAGKLKQIASLLTGIPVENFEDQEFKKNLLDVEWGTVQNVPLNSIPPFADMQFNVMISVREFLQKLGTEAMRDGLHTNVWVNALMCDYRRPKMSEYNPSNWIITDMRFPNEMEAVKERRGLTIRVVRQYSKEDLCKGSSPYIRDEELSAKLAKRYRSFESLPIVPPPHASETAIDDAEFDYKIINDGSIDDLIEKVRQILITEKII